MKSESEKRTERRNRAKTTISLMLQADRADVVAALVRCGYIEPGVVPTDKQVQDAAQAHYLDMLKDGTRVPRILTRTEPPAPLPHGVKIDPKAGKKATQYDKWNAQTYSRIYAPDEKADFLKERPDLTGAFAEAAKLHPRPPLHPVDVEYFRRRKAERLRESAPPDLTQPRKSGVNGRNTGHIPTVTDKKKRESQADTVKPIKRSSKAEVKRVEKELGFEMESDKGVHTLRPGKGGIEREADKWVADDELGGRRKYTGKVHYKDDEQ